MGLSNTTDRNAYIGNGSTSVYSYTFPITLQSDLLVMTRVVLTGVEATLAINTDYTVAGAGNVAGGSITLLAGNLPTTQVIMIRRIRPLTQTTDIRNQTSFYAATHENVFDNLTMLLQQTQDELNRAAILPETFTKADFDPTLPAFGLIGQANVSLITDITGTKFIAGPALDASTFGITNLNTDVVANGPGNVPATIALNAVTNAKAGQMPTLTIKGNNTGATANPQDLTAAQTLAMLPAVIGDTGSGGTKGIAPAPAAGDAAAGKFLKADGTWTVPPVGAGTISSLTGDVTASGSGAVVSTIAANVVDNTKASQVPTLTIKGNNTGSTANVQDLTVAQVNAILPVVTSSLKGLAPSSGGGTTNFLRADGTWATPAGAGGITALTSDVTASGTGSVAATIAANAVTNAKAAQMATLTIKGNNTGSTANAADLTVAQVNAILPVVTSTLNGLAPLSGGGTTNFLRADGSWAVPASGGSGITALTGDVTATGTGSVAATIAANAVTNAKAAQMATLTIKGNNTGSTANAADLTATQTTAILNAVVGDSGSGGTKGLTPAPGAGDTAAGKFLKADGTWQVPGGTGIGTVTTVSVASANGFTGTVANATSTPAITVATSITGILKGNGTAISAATSGTDYALPNANTTGTAASVTGTNVVTNTNLSQMATLTLKGNNTGSTANAADLTVAQVNAILPVMTSSLNGLAPLSGGGTTNFLRADGTWSAPSGGGGGTAPLMPISSQSITFNFGSTTSNSYYNFASGTAITGTLPAASAVANGFIVVAGFQASSSWSGIQHTIAVNSGDSININSTTVTSVKIATPGEVWKLVSDGVSVWTIAEHQSNYSSTSYVPTITGLGTVTSVSAVFSRTGKYLTVQGTCTAGTISAVLISCSLPSASAALQIDTTRISLANTTAQAGPQVGFWVPNTANPQQNKAVTAIGTSTSLVYCSGNATPLLPETGSACWASSVLSTFNFTVPIAGWSD